MNSKLLFKLTNNFCTGILCCLPLYITDSLAAVLNYPGAVAGFPYAMTAADTLNINSGVAASTNNLHYSVLMKSNTVLDVHVGATLSYAGDNPNASTVSLEEALAANSSLYVRGELNKGTGRFSFFSKKGVIAANTLRLYVERGTIVGDVYLNAGGASVPALNIDVSGSINGEVWFDENPGTITVGNIGAVNKFTTLNNIQNANIVNIVNGTFRNEHLIKFKGANKDLDVQLAGVFEHAGTSTDLADANILGKLILEKNLTATTSVALNHAAAELHVNKSVTVTTPVFDLNAGTLMLNYAALNSYGKLILPDTNLTCDAAATVKFTHTNGYLPGKKFVLVTGNAAADPDLVNLITQKNTSIFIDALDLSQDGNNIVLNVTRKTFDTFTVNELDKSIALNLEVIGNNQPSDLQIKVLDWLDSSTGSAELTTRLDLFKLGMFTALPSTNLQSSLPRIVSNRLAKILDKKYLAASDVEHNTEFWGKLNFTSVKHKKHINNLANKELNFSTVIGVDNIISYVDKIGIAIGFTNSSINNDVSSLSQFIKSSKISAISLAMMPYFIHSFENGTVMEVVLGFNINQYKQMNAVVVNGLIDTNLAGNRREIGMSAAMNLGYNFYIFDYISLAVIGFGNTSYTYRPAYSDLSVPGFDIKIKPGSKIAFEVGSRVELGYPFTDGEVTLFPKAFVQYKNDLFGDSQTIRANLTNGLHNIDYKTSYSRYSFMLGSTFTAEVNNTYQLDLSYGFDFSKDMQGHNFSAKLRYKF